MKCGMLFPWKLPARNFHVQTMKFSWNLAHTKRQDDEEHQVKGSSDNGHHRAHTKLEAPAHT